MRGLVVGGGSIGKRHLANLQTLGITDLGLVEPDRERRARLAEGLDISRFENLADGLRWSPKFVVICTPSYLHAKQALQVVQAGCDVFVEKPLSHTPECLNEIVEIIDRGRIISLVGCNMRFHPGPAQVKDLIDRGVCGKILFSRLHTGSYLPDWRPDSDYRTNYASRVEMGGGCILDCIHEIDLARWYMGEVQEVVCVADHLSELEICTEDFAILICRHLGRTVSEIHLDYVQRTYERGCQIVGERGSIFWDVNANEVRWYDAISKDWVKFQTPDDWQPNQMYLDEIEHFLDHVAARQETILPVSDAVKVMQVAFAAKTSSAQRTAVSTGLAE